VYLCFISGGQIRDIWIETLSQGRVNSENVVNIYDYYTNLALFGGREITNDTRNATLQVKACRDVCILLSKSRDLISMNTYEICFGEIGNWKNDEDPS